MSTTRTKRLIHTETLQLAEMQVKDLIQTPLEARFNRLARVTRRALDTRVATISFLSRDGEWFKAAVGWNVSDLPAGRSLAAVLVGDDGAIAVANLLEDERTRSHPLVTDSPRFRFCALYPIKDRFGNAIGAVTAYDIEPRTVKADLLEAISDIGELAQRELLLSEVGGVQQQLLKKLDTSRRQALLDELTRLWNRRGAMTFLEQLLAAEGRRDSTVAICVIDVDDFKLINDRYGHAMGDVVLRKLAAVIVDSVRPGDIACRLGGDEFMLIIPDANDEQLAAIMDRVRDRVKSLVIRTRAGAVRVTVSVGGSLAARSSLTGADDLMHRADEAMYEEKKRRAGDHVA
jgi:diguanylate cyclase (GGDEF)-like protein